MIGARLGRMSAIRVAAVGLAAGLTTAFSLPPWGFWILAPLGLAVLYRLLEGRGAPTRALAGFTFGIGLLAIGLFFTTAFNPYRLIEKHADEEHNKNAKSQITRPRTQRPQCVGRLRRGRLRRSRLTGRDNPVRSGLSNRTAEGTQGAGRQRRVPGPQRVPDHGGTVAERGQHQGPVGNGLGGRQPDARADRVRRGRGSPGRVLVVNQVHDVEPTVLARGDGSDGFGSAGFWL